MSEQNKHYHELKEKGYEIISELHDGRIVCVKDRRNYIYVPKTGTFLDMRDKQ